MHSYSKSGGDSNRIDNAASGYMAIVPSVMAVRRLSVIECSRLQGFPDTFLYIDRKPRKITEDDARYLLSHGVHCWLEDGRWRTKCPADGPMYKALGNSIAIPCLRWIGRRIQLVDAIQKMDEVTQ